MQVKARFFKERKFELDKRVQDIKDLNISWNLYNRCPF